MDDSRFVKNVEGLVKRLRDKADELAATPPTIDRLGLLPHVLKRLAVIDEARSGRLVLFATSVLVNTRLDETRLVALTAVQNLLVETQNTLASLESTGIHQCANLLHCFETVMTLTAPVWSSVPRTSWSLMRFCVEAASVCVSSISLKDRFNDD